MKAEKPKPVDKENKERDKDDGEKSQAGSAKKKGAKDDAGPSVQEGIYMFPNGDKYEGAFVKSSDGVLSRSGQGSHTSPDGTVYTGEWVNDKMTGAGRLQFPSGAVYEGNFVNNAFHGKGRYSWPNGSFYEGQFNENKLEGDGEFNDTDNQIWTGMFRYKAAPGLRFKLSL